MLLLLPATASHAERRCLDEAPVCLEILEDAGTTRFIASNATQRPWSFRVAVERLDNLEPNRPLPLRAVVEPGQEREIGRLSRVDPDRNTRWSSSWGAAAGSMLARPDTRFRYRMPFGGDTPRVLSQGVGGRFSHTGAAAHSFDFSMPAGTPVLAAREGRVVSVRDGLLDSGRRKLRYDEANAVEVLHADGTVGVYSHLRKGIDVQVGDRIMAGQRLGVSGDSGYSTGPHLHFMVWRRLADLSWASVPVRFDDGTAAGFVPTTGVAYAPACAWEKGDCDVVPASASEAPPVGVRDAARGDAKVGGSGARRDDGACECANGAIIHVDLPCSQVCVR